MYLMQQKGLSNISHRTMPFRHTKYKKYIFNEWRILE